MEPPHSPTALEAKTVIGDVPLNSPSSLRGMEANEEREIMKDRPMTEALLKQCIEQTQLPYSEREEGDTWVYAGEHRIGIKSMLLGTNLKAVQGRIQKAVSGEKEPLGRET